MDSFANEALQLIYQRKYLSLKRRCEEVQQANEKLVNRIHNVKKILRRYKKERSVLMDRLDQRNDDYQHAMVPAFWEEGDEGQEAEIEDEQETSLAVAAIADVKLEPGVSMDSHVTSLPQNEGSKKLKKFGKKPANAYLIFCTMQRKAAQAKYLEIHGEEASHTELTKHLAQEWRQLSAEEKQIYYDIAEQKKKKDETSVTSQSRGERSNDVTAESKMAAASSVEEINQMMFASPNNEIVYASADTNAIYHVMPHESSLQAEIKHAQFGVLDTTDLELKTEVKDEHDSKDFL